VCKDPMDGCTFPARPSSDSLTCALPKNLKDLPPPKGLTWKSAPKTQAVPLSGMSKQIDGCSITRTTGIAIGAKSAGKTIGRFVRMDVDVISNPRCKVARTKLSSSNPPVRALLAAASLPIGVKPWTPRKDKQKRKKGGKGLSFNLDNKDRDCHIRAQILVLTCRDKSKTRTFQFKQAKGKTSKHTFSCGCPALHKTSMSSKVVWMRNTLAKTQKKCAKRFAVLSEWVYQQLKSPRSFLPSSITTVSKTQARGLHEFAKYNVQELPALMMRACRTTPWSASQFEVTIAADAEKEKKERVKKAVKQAQQKAAAAQAAAKYGALEAKEVAAEAKMKAARGAESKSKKAEFERQKRANNAKFKAALLQAEHKKQRAKRLQRQHANP